MYELTSYYFEYYEKILYTRYFVDIYLKSFIIKYFLYLYLKIGFPQRPLSLFSTQLLRQTYINILCQVTKQFTEFLVCEVMKWVDVVLWKNIDFTYCFIKKESIANKWVFQDLINTDKDVYKEKMQKFSSKFSVNHGWVVGKVFWFFLFMMHGSWQT